MDFLRLASGETVRIIDEGEAARRLRRDTGPAPRRQQPAASSRGILTNREQLGVFVSLLLPAGLRAPARGISDNVGTSRARFSSGKLRPGVNFFSTPTKEGKNPRSAKR